jgi:hypothetical protein
MEDSHRPSEPAIEFDAGEVALHETEAGVAEKRFQVGTLIGRRVVGGHSVNTYDFTTFG